MLLAVLHFLLVENLDALAQGLVLLAEHVLDLHHHLDQVRLDMGRHRREGVIALGKLAYRRPVRTDAGKIKGGLADFHPTVPLVVM
ncbi:hypothetical protein D9M71_829880 [compost metagenome]